MLQPPTFEQGPRETFFFPQAEIELPDPGAAPIEPQTSLTTLLMPVGFTVMGLVVMVAVGAAMGGQSMWLSMAVSLPMMLGSYVVSFVNYRNQKKKYSQEKADRESKYRALLDQRRQELQKFSDQTRRVFFQGDPDPESCLQIARECKPGYLWSRAPYDDDFLTVRLGTYDERAFQVKVKSPKQVSEMNPDPLVAEARTLADAFARIPDTPLTVALRDVGVMGFTGAREAVLNAARVLIMQLATHHAPHEVKIVAFYPEKEASSWAWLRWLPHVWDNEREKRFLACESGGAQELLEELEIRLRQRLNRLDRSQGVLPDPLPYYIFILADPGLIQEEPIYPLLLKQGAALGAIPILLGGLPKQCQSRVKFEGGKSTYLQGGANPASWNYRSDHIDIETMDNFSRILAPLRMKRTDSADALPSRVPLFEILGIQQPEELNVVQRWNKNSPYRTMSVPIGKREGGEFRYLDLHEPRGAKEPNLQRGHGPNALIAGMAGAGKGELLQSMIVSLAANFHPHQLVFVLIDFKGGAMSRAVKRLPHVINELTDLDKPSILGAIEALNYEIKRREHLIVDAGVQHIDDYQKLYTEGKVKEPLPYLVFIADEFTALKQEMPATMQLFDFIAQKGRALGFRMILCTQKPEGVISQQVEANTGLRICLKVAKAEDSQAVLKKPDAAAITRSGQGYLRMGEGQLEPFQSAFANAPYSENSDTGEDVDVLTVSLNGKRRPLQIRPMGETESSAKQLLVVVDYICRAAEEAGIEQLPGIWMPPLPTALTWKDVRLSGGWDGRCWHPVTHWLSPVLGMQDDPSHQRQPLLQLDLGRRGNLFICGGTGLETRRALRTLITCLAHDHSPEDLNLYCLDLGSYGLRVFDSLPQVGAIINRDEVKRIHRLFRWLLAEALPARKNWLARVGMASLADARMQGGRFDIPAAIVLIVDNVTALKDDANSGWEESLKRLATEGPAAGIHLVLAGDSTSLISFYKVMENVNQLRLALQLSDAPAYKNVVGPYSNSLVLQAGVPGRGLCLAGGVLECQVAEAVSSEGDPDGKLRQISESMRQVWTQTGGRLPHPIGELPNSLTWADLGAMSEVTFSAERREATSLYGRLGVDDLSLSPTGLDLEEDGPNFMVVGPKKSGKTTLLRTWILALAGSYSPEQVQFVIFDSVKGELSPFQSLPHVACYASIDQESQVEALRWLREQLMGRISAKKVGARPALVVLVDDAESLTSDAVKSALSNHIKTDSPYGLYVVVTMASDKAKTLQYQEPYKLILAQKSGVLIGCHDVQEDSGLFGLTEKGKLPPGRAYWVRHGQLGLVQVAMMEDVIKLQAEIDRLKAPAENG